MAMRSPRKRVGEIPCRFESCTLRMKNRKTYLMKDLAIITFSIVIAIMLAKTGILKDLLVATQGLKFLGSFLAGIFFISVFTVAPATVVLIGLFQSAPLLEIAFFGGLGALVGDLIIFRFIKYHLTEDIAYLIAKNRNERLKEIFRLRFFKWLIPFLGALIIASPLPDEIGLAMMGLSKMKTLLFIPISFVLNFLGILVIGLIARGV